jgi:hypothetical protein
MTTASTTVVVGSATRLHHQGVIPDRKERDGVVVAEVVVVDVAVVAKQKEDNHMGFFLRIVGDPNTKEYHR